jgi:hypothetical protein
MTHPATSPTKGETGGAETPDSVEIETAVCRGCGRTLKGRPFCYGGSAYIPETLEQAKVNWYGGFVCSRECDFKASLALERDMPGHGIQQTTLGQSARASLERNWS